MVIKKLEDFPEFQLLYTWPDQNICHYAKDMGKFLNHRTPPQLHLCVLANFQRDKLNKDVLGSLT
jgi:hypothetical protein